MTHSPFHPEEQAESTGLFGDAPGKVVDYYTMPNQSYGDSGAWMVRLVVEIEDENGIRQKPQWYSIGFLNELVPAVGDQPVWSKDDYDEYPGDEQAFQDWVTWADSPKIDQEQADALADAMRGTNLLFIPGELRSDPRSKKRKHKVSKKQQGAFLMAKLHELGINVDAVWGGDRDQIVGKWFYWERLPNADDKYKDAKDVLVPTELISEPQTDQGASEGAADSDIAPVVAYLEEHGPTAQNDLAAYFLKTGNGGLATRLMQPSFITDTGLLLDGEGRVALAG